jgi:hypothetical protein
MPTIYHLKPPRPAGWAVQWTRRELATKRRWRPGLPDRAAVVMLDTAGALIEHHPSTMASGDVAWLREKALRLLGADLVRRLSGAHSGSQSPVRC